MKKEMTFDQWSEHTSDILWDEVKRQELNHIDELDPNLVIHIQHKMSEAWINHKAKSGQLILA